MTPDAELYILLVPNLLKPVWAKMNFFHRVLLLTCLLLVVSSPHKSSYRDGWSSYSNTCVLRIRTVLGWQLVCMRQCEKETLIISEIYGYLNVATFVLSSFKGQL